MEIELYLHMPASRPAHICLGLQGHSVFADFDLDPDGRLFLVRISFDGYGCCIAPAGMPRLNLGDSATFLAMRERGAFDADVAAPILSAYFSEHRDLLWPDALQEHDLLEQACAR